MSEEDNNQEDEKPVNLEVKCAYANTIINAKTGYQAQLAYRCEFWQNCPLQIHYSGESFCGGEFNPKKYKVDPNQRTVVNPKGKTFRSMLDFSKPEDSQDQLP
jgi:hypothetical protein